MLIVTHDKDLDGHASGAILLKKFPDARYMGYDYGQPFNPAIEPGETLIMADVSLPMPQMMELAEKYNFVWIDHHKSAIDDLAGTTVNHPFIAVLEVGRAACELCWEWAFPEEEMPLGIKLLGMYDTWRNEDEEDWNENILPFQYGMRIEGYTALTLPDWCMGSYLEDIMGVEAAISSGKAILKYQKSQNEFNARYAFDARINIEGTNFRAVCVNKAPHNSMSFEPVWDESKYDVMVPFGFDGKTWSFSFYTTKPDVDCAWIAKQFLGGGHKQAAAAKSDDIRKVLIF